MSSAITWQNARAREQGLKGEALFYFRNRSELNGREGLVGGFRDLDVLCMYEVLTSRLVMLLWTRPGSARWRRWRSRLMFGSWGCCGTMRLSSVKNIIHIRYNDENSAYIKKYAYLNVLHVNSLKDKASILQLLSIQISHYSFYTSI